MSGNLPTLDTQSNPTLCFRAVEKPESPHLDEMNRTDTGPVESRNHYNVMAFVEVEVFLERFPARGDEFIRRARGTCVRRPVSLQHTLGLSALVFTRRAHFTWALPKAGTERVFGPSITPTSLSPHGTQSAP